MCRRGVFPGLAPGHAHLQPAQILPQPSGGRAGGQGLSSAQSPLSPLSPPLTAHNATATAIMDWKPLQTGTK